MTVILDNNLPWRMGKALQSMHWNLIQRMFLFLVGALPLQQRDLFSKRVINEQVN